jgi:hypothetical protein
VAEIAVIEEVTDITVAVVDAVIVVATDITMVEEVIDIAFAEVATVILAVAYCNGRRCV